MEGAPSTPDADALERIAADDWAWLLPHLRSALLAVPAERVTPVVARLRSAPAVKLAGGRTRRDAARLLAAGGEVWRDVHGRIAAASDRPRVFDRLLAGELAAPGRATDAGGTAPGDEDQRNEALERARQRARSMQEERDDARRRLEGAEARATTAERRVDQLEAEVAGLAEALAAAQGQVDEAEAERERIVDRERRRAASERRELEDELSGLRRELHEVRAEAQRSADDGGGAAGASRTSPSRPRPRTVGDRLVAGRPSTLPHGVERGTRAAADALLGTGRLVFVDGYNLTRTQRGDLDLAAQRRWLAQALATLVARTRIEPTVWFDSTIAGSAGRQESARGVRIRYTSDGLTADDEIVFAVAALEPHVPVIVVTDDRGLRERLRPYAIDLLDTASFRWVLD